MRVADVAPAVRQKLGHDGTDGLLAAFDLAKREWTEDVLTRAVDRFERRLAEEMSATRTELRAVIADQSGTLRAEIAACRTDLVRWMFLFWTGHLVALAALLATLR